MALGEFQVRSHGSFFSAVASSLLLSHTAFTDERTQATVVVCTVSSIYAPEAFKSFRVDTWWPPSLVFFFPSHSVCEDDQL